jgi:hypothetical protein
VNCNFGNQSRKRRPKGNFSFFTFFRVLYKPTRRCAERRRRFHSEKCPTNIVSFYLFPSVQNSGKSNAAFWWWMSGVDR